MTSTRVKIVILGEKGAGKTSIISTYVTGEFQENTISPIGINFISKQIHFKHTSVRLDLWDTDQLLIEDFGKLFWRGINAVLIIYDMQDNYPKDNLKKWIEIVRKETFGDDLLIFIAASKCDLDQGIYEVPLFLSQFADKFNIEIFRISSKKNLGLDNLFSKIATSVLNLKKNVRTSISLSRASHSIKLESLKKKRTNCC